jgi:hypothetical protein
MIKNSNKMRFFGENLEKYYVTIKIFDNDDD